MSENLVHYRLMECPKCGKEVGLYLKEIGDARLVCPECNREMISGVDRRITKGYCFDCHTEFETSKLTNPCPNCGSQYWSTPPKKPD